MNKFLKWQNSEVSRGKQILYFAIGALIFPTAIPAMLVFLLPQVDKAIGIASFYCGTINIIAGIVLLIPGGMVAFSTIIAQIRFASGTPFPMMPTRKLLVGGTFKYCRNPMTLGTIMMYTGIALMAGSVTSVLFVVMLALTLLTYIKLVEEKELVLRFGQEYIDYKKDTPFIIPSRFSRKTGEK